MHPSASLNRVCTDDQFAPLKPGQRSIDSRVGRRASSEHPLNGSRRRFSMSALSSFPMKHWSTRNARTAARKSHYGSAADRHPHRRCRPDENITSCGIRNGNARRFVVNSVIIIRQVISERPSRFSMTSASTRPTSHGTCTQGHRAGRGDLISTSRRTSTRQSATMSPVAVGGRRSFMPNSKSNRRPSSVTARFPDGYQRRSRRRESPSPRYN